MSAGPAGLYIHVPFCRRVCPYCDFAVRTGDAARRERYVGYLVRELAQHAEAAQADEGAGWRFDTLYFGGGTPSLLTGEQIDRIVATARECFAFETDTRMFLEANPEDVDERAVVDWRRTGIETLSLGVQSFDDAALGLLGREHSAAIARNAVELARGAGVRTISIDLIYGRPGQTVDSWSEELAIADGVHPDHLSCYQLTVHPRTRFELLRRRGQFVPLPDDGQAEMFRATHRDLDRLGYPGYEVSQFAASPDHRSRHNMKYWDHTPYLGVGPSAHSFRAGRRWWNIRRTDDWQQAIEAGGPPTAGDEQLTQRQLALEVLMTGLRTHAGVDVDRMLECFGVDLIACNEPLLERLAGEGLLAPVEPGARRVVPTLEGLAVADRLASELRLSPV